MTNREMFLLATSILFASTTAGFVLQGAMHKGPHHRPGFDRPWEGRGGPDGKRERPDFFAMIDANKDGFITRDEMAAHHAAKLDEMFATVDTDKDGKLSKDEMEKGRELMRAKMKERFKAAQQAEAKSAE